MATIEQKPAIALSVLDDNTGGASFRIGVALWGFHQGGKIKLSFVEVNSDDKNGQPDRVLGAVEGMIVPAVRDKPYAYSFLPDKRPDDPPAKTKVKIVFSFAKPGKLSPKDPEPEDKPLVFALSDDTYDVDEGDFWEVQVRAEAEGVASQVIPLARIRRQLENNEPHTYDWHDGHDIQLYHDGSKGDHGSEGAFVDLEKAIEDAQHLVFIADWSFQPLHRMTRTAAKAGPEDTVGAQLIRKAKAKSDCLIAIHTWEHTTPLTDKENDAGNQVLDSIAKGLGLGLNGRPGNLLWRATSREGLGWSHHQKFVVVDSQAGDRRDLKVFFGGLDLTKGRFDWPAHVVSPHDSFAWPFQQHWNTLDNKFHTDDWYNNEFADDKERETLPRQPWHDIYMWAHGPCAWDFLREFVGRWTRTPSWGGNSGDTSANHLEAVWKKYRQLRGDRKTFVQPYDGQRDGIWALQVYRSLASAHWAPPDRKPKDDADKAAFKSVTWTKGVPSAENSIERAYRHAIGQAEKFIYIENQYLIGSGKEWQGEKIDITNNVPKAIVDRILHQAAAKKPFHVYIVKPMFPEGDPVGISSVEIRKNEWLTAQYMVQTLAQTLGKRWTKYLSFYFLANWERKDNPASKGRRQDRLRVNDRYMVYVHSKFMIVDDRYFILGSANLNERSLNGDHDSEIACGVWPGHGHDGDARDTIRSFRKELWKSHFGSKVRSADQPESEECVSSVRKVGDDNYKAFRTLTAKPNGHACRWPYGLDGKGLLAIDVGKDYKVFDDSKYMPDSPSSKKDWRWDCPGSLLLWTVGERKLGQ